MAVILYAVTKDNFFCKEESKDGKVDDLSWMRVTTDRQLFRTLTTMKSDQTLIAGYKTARVLPQLPGRKIISVSSARTRGIELSNALQRYSDAFVIGGASVLKSCMKFCHRDYIDTVITIRLPITINPKEDPDDFIQDPLFEFKEAGVLKRASSFYMYSDNFEAPTVLMEIWKPSWKDNNGHTK